LKTTNKVNWYHKRNQLNIVDAQAEAIS